MVGVVSAGDADPKTNSPIPDISPKDTTVLEWAKTHKDYSFDGHLVREFREGGSNPIMYYLTINKTEWNPVISERIYEDQKFPRELIKMSKDQRIIFSTMILREMMSSIDFTVPMKLSTGNGEIDGYAVIYPRCRLDKTQDGAIKYVVDPKESNILYLSKGQYDSLSNILGVRPARDRGERRVYIDAEKIQDKAIQLWVDTQIARKLEPGQLIEELEKVNATNLDLTKIKTKTWYPHVNYSPGGNQDYVRSMVEIPSAGGTRLSILTLRKALVLSAKYPPALFGKSVIKIPYPRCAEPVDALGKVTSPYVYEPISYVISLTEEQFNSLLAIVNPR